jgi:hypothetical protein
MQESAPARARRPAAREPPRRLAGGSARSIPRGRPRGPPGPAVRWRHHPFRVIDPGRSPRGGAAQLAFHPAPPQRLLESLARMAPHVFVWVLQHLLDERPRRAAVGPHAFEVVDGHHACRRVLAAQQGHARVDRSGHVLADEVERACGPRPDTLVVVAQRGTQLRFGCKGVGSDGHQCSRSGASNFDRRIPQRRREDGHDDACALHDMTLPDLVQRRQALCTRRAEVHWGQALASCARETEADHRA